LNLTYFDELNMESNQSDSARQKRIREIAERISKVRKEKGVTQVEMAKKLKTTQSMYSRYENGEIRIYADTFLKMSQVLGVTPNELFGTTKSGNDAADPIEHSIPKRILRKMRGVENLTRLQQDSLILIIEGIVNVGNKKRANKNPNESTAST
jgi:transcriptional regulator with XRE-family HTH domain